MRSIPTSEARLVQELLDLSQSWGQQGELFSPATVFAGSVGAGWQSIEQRAGETAGAEAFSKADESAGHSEATNAGTPSQPKLAFPKVGVVGLVVRQPTTKAATTRGATQEGSKRQSCQGRRRK